MLVIILAVARPQPSWAADETQNANWPEWRGPSRDDISTETGLLKQWPEGGPQLLWAASGCGQGFSSVTIADGLIYTAGNFDDETFVVALGLNGKLKWKSLNGRRWTVPPQKWAKNTDGARATPTVNDGLVYHLNALGRLAAFDAKTGEESWALDIPQKFNSKVPMWGCSESVLIDRNNVICYPGGSKGCMVALNKKTGKLVWVNTDIGDPPANCSPILIEDHGIRQIITMTTVAVLGEADGKGSSALLPAQGCRSRVAAGFQCSCLYLNDTRLGVAGRHIERHLERQRPAIIVAHLQRQVPDVAATIGVKQSKLYRLGRFHCVFLSLADECYGAVSSTVRSRNRMFTIGP